jgi:C4-dicarboxylate-specific signal transduction histidine kinase
MSDRDDDHEPANGSRSAPRGETDQPDSLQSRAAAGALARGVACELVRPLRELREDLAVLVEVIDRHMAAARGPKGLPWKEVEATRQQLAHCYLRSRKMARLVSELAEAIAPAASGPEPVDVNKVVESALNLSRHRVAADTEVFIDLGSLPLVRVARGDLLLAVARMVGVAADSASGAEGSALSIKTRRERNQESGSDDVVIFVADNGRGRPQAAASVDALAARVAQAAGGGFSGTSERDKGSVFELRLPTGRQ